jgi:hypothetical protein
MPMAFLHNILNQFVQMASCFTSGSFWKITAERWCFSMYSPNP